MTYRVEIARTAEADIREASRWIAESSPQRAERWRSRLLKKIETLSSHPKRCPVTDEGEVFGEEVRVLLFGKRPGVHRILFAIRADSVVILHVRHAARGPFEP